MRISFQGRYAPRDLVSEVSALLFDFADLGVDEVDGINLYLNLRTRGESVHIHTQGGERVDILTIRGRAVHSYAQNHDGALDLSDPTAKRRDFR